MRKFIVIIPARYASTRFPGKPLAEIAGKPMIQHVYERCKRVIDTVYIATDDDRIAEAVKGFKGNCIMTSPDHLSGTDRCAEAARLLQKEIDFDVVINVQGDEPFLASEQLSQIMDCFEDKQADIATLISPIADQETLFNPNKVKAITGIDGYALYFSRHPIPYQRDLPEAEWPEHHPYFLHLGIYAFRKEVLQLIVRHPPSKLEVAEKLEQLRWLENGFRIKTAINGSPSFGIDTPEDLLKLFSK